MSITLNKPEWIPSIDLLARGLLSLFTHNEKAVCVSVLKSWERGGGGGAEMDASHKFKPVTSHTPRPVPAASARAMQMEAASCRAVSASFEALEVKKTPQQPQCGFVREVVSSERVLWDSGVAVKCFTPAVVQWDSQQLPWM